MVGVRRVAMSTMRVPGLTRLGLQDAAEEHRVHLRHVVAPQDEVVASVEVLVAAHRLVALELREESRHRARHAEPRVGFEVVAAQPALHPFQRRVAVEDGPLSRAVHAHGAGAVLVERGLEARGDQVQRFVPRDAREAAVGGSLLRIQQPVLAVEQAWQVVALDAQQPLVHRAGLVAAHGDDAPLLHAHHHAAAGAAEAARRLGPRDRGAIDRSAVRGQSRGLLAVGAGVRRHGRQRPPPARTSAVHRRHGALAIRSVAGVVGGLDIGAAPVSVAAISRFDGVGLLLGALLQPLVLGPAQDLVDHGVGTAAPARPARPASAVAGDLARLGDELHVEALGHLEHAVPLGVVGRHHRGAHARAPAFVVPQVEPGPLDLLVVLRLGDEAVRRQRAHDRLARLGELLVVVDHQVVVLPVEQVDVVRRVAVRAHVLHAVALGVGRCRRSRLAALLGVGLGHDRVVGVGVHHQADRRAVGPRNALARIVRDLHAVAECWRTCGTSRRSAPRCSPRPAPTARASRFISAMQVAEGHAVLRLVVDLLLRMVGAEVALAAVLRLAGAARREVVPAVAGRARARASRRG